MVSSSWNSTVMTVRKVTEAGVEPEGSLERRATAPAVNLGLGDRAESRTRSSAFGERRHVLVLAIVVPPARLELAESR